MKKRLLIIKNDFALVPLSSGNTSIIDLEDIEQAAKYNWIESKNGRTSYAHNISYPNGKHNLCRDISLHRLILNAINSIMQVDHIDGDGLNNRRSNLRLCEPKNNYCNRKLNANSTTKYKGVRLHKPTGKWMSHIKHNGKQIHLGYFIALDDAAKAYDEKAVELFGEFAKLNFQ